MNAIPQSGLKRVLGSLFSGVKTMAGEEASHISTNEFSAACLEGRVAQIYVREFASGFSMYVQLSGCEPLRVLGTPSKLVRNWPSLNTLVAFLHRHQLQVPEITLRLNSFVQPESDTK